MAKILISTDNSQDKVVFANPGESPVNPSAGVILVAAGSAPNKRIHGMVSGIVFDNPGQ